MNAIRKLKLFEADVAEAAAWYETQRPGLGEQFISTVQSTDQLLLANPFRYAVRFEDTRRLNLKRFPYGIFFLVHGDEIVVCCPTQPAGYPSGP